MPAGEQPWSGIPSTSPRLRKWLRRVPRAIVRNCEGVQVVLQLGHGRLYQRTSIYTGADAGQTTRTRSMAEQLVARSSKDAQKVVSCSCSRVTDVEHDDMSKLSG